MKAGIHPNYQSVNVACACGNAFPVGSTSKQNIQTEICSNCHPFYTGKQKLLDAAGTVDRFKKRVAAAATVVKAEKKPRKTRSTKQASLAA